LREKGIFPREKTGGKKNAGCGLTRIVNRLYSS